MLTGDQISQIETLTMQGSLALLSAAGILRLVIHDLMHMKEEIKKEVKSKERREHRHEAVRVAGNS